MKCTQCNGEGYTANDDECSPWSFWENLPAGSDLAVRLGIVKKITCTFCNGLGFVIS